MKQILAAFFILTSAIFLFSINGYANTLPEGDFEDQLRLTGKAKVVEVVNPLTVKLDDGRFIHLVGLDIPDLDYYEPGELSVTAVKILDDFLKDKRVYVYQTRSSNQGRINRLGHHIAHLVRIDDNVWAQGLLLSLGVARVRTTINNPEMAEQMLNLEQSARSEQQGLWGSDDYKVLTPQEAKKHIGSYQIVQGRIYNVSMYKNRLYLNFGMNWKEDFTISISAFDLRKFTKAKLDPQGWNGKDIRVRGWIKSYNGPYIEIDNPSNLEAIFEDGSVVPDQKQDAPPEPEPEKKIKTDRTSGLPSLNP